MRIRELPDADLLRQLIDYNPDTGAMLWLSRRDELFATARAGLIWHKKHCGKPVGALSSDGYLSTRVLGRSVLLHRVAWKIAYGTDPEFIDHINGDRADNRLLNLRSVSLAENALNQRRYTNNKSGIPGVHWSPARNRWVATIYLSPGRQKVLKVSKSKAEAVAARKAAELDHGGFHPNHGR